MSDATKAQGTLLQVDVSTVYTTVAEVTGIEGPGLSAELIDVTNHSSASGYREVITGLLDAGEVTFDINYLPANARHDASTGLISYLTGQTEEAWKIIFTDTGSTEFTFNGYVTNFAPSAPIDGALTASVTIKVTGAPTLA